MIKNSKQGDLIAVKRIVSVNCADLSPHFVTTENRHGAWEFVYVDSGSIESVTEDGTRKIGQGQLIFHRPDEEHSTVCNRRQSATIFTVIFECDSSAIALFDKRIFDVPQSLRPLFTDLIHECEKTYDISKTPIVLKKNAPVGAEQLARVYLEAFLIRLLRAELPTAPEGNGGENKSSGGSLAREIAEFLDAHLSQRVTLDELSEEFHFGKVYLCDVFKRDMGISIMTYLLDRKIDEAKRLLRESDLTVSEISEHLGFESPSYFSRCFRNRVGHPPKSFRKMLISSSTVKRR